MLYRLMRRIWKKEMGIEAEFEDYGNFVRVQLNFRDLGIEGLIIILEKAKRYFEGYDLMLWWGQKCCDLYIGEVKVLDQLDLDGISLRVK